MAGENQATEEFIQQGRFILAYLDETVYNPERSAYMFSSLPGFTFLHLYSNVTTIQALVKAYLVTGEETYLQRATSTAESLELLKSPDFGGYYAAEPSLEYADIYSEIGASGYAYGYIPLSGANYLIYSNILLYQATGDVKYLKRVKEILDFIKNSLFDGNVALHDIWRGNVSHRYCTGCNLQLLYNILLFDEILRSEGLTIDDL